MSNELLCGYRDSYSEGKRSCKNPATLLVFSPAISACEATCFEHLARVIAWRAKNAWRIVHYVHPIIPSMIVGVQGKYPQGTSRGVEDSPDEEVKENEVNYRDD